MISAKTKGDIKLHERSSNYRKIGQNIYRTNKRYRVRISINNNKLTAYTSTRREARELRDKWKNLRDVKQEENMSRM